MEPMTQPRTDDEIDVSQSLDCSGLLCPLPVFKTTVALKRLASGEVLELICTDPGSLADIPALARRCGHQLLRTVEDNGTQTFWLRKA
jgi:tRNA 2-thiouridine synthesizing protein A